MSASTHWRAKISNSMPRLSSSCYLRLDCGSVLKSLCVRQLILAQSFAAYCPFVDVEVESRCLLSSLVTRGNDRPLFSLMWRLRTNDRRTKWFLSLSMSDNTWQEISAYKYQCLWMRTISPRTPARHWGSAAQSRRQWFCSHRGRDPPAKFTICTTVTRSRKLQSRTLI
ncbi:hypothetical protein NPIL_123311 [Nephila pilipes]|uniref:Uncharacterized protein n=1 Tax=Nephila pilipes TaxID=299642 RepID=A0A8X6M690_NEPPI|nr:hypothetical protein NPIL_123311 [Nephila pilipes]